MHRGCEPMLLLSHYDVDFQDGLCQSVQLWLQGLSTKSVLSYNPQQTPLSKVCKELRVKRARISQCTSLAILGNHASMGQIRS